MVTSIVSQYIKGVAFASSIDDAKKRLQALAPDREISFQSINDKNGNRIALLMNRKTIVIARTLASATLICCHDFIIKASAKSGLKILCLFNDKEKPSMIIFDGEKIIDHPCYEVDKNGMVTFSLLGGEWR